MTLTSPVWLSLLLVSLFAFTWTTGVNANPYIADNSSARSFARGVFLQSMGLKHRRALLGPNSFAVEGSPCPAPTKLDERTFVCADVLHIWDCHNGVHNGKIACASGTACCTGTDGFDRCSTSCPGAQTNALLKDQIEAFDLTDDIERDSLAENDAVDSNLELSNDSESDGLGDGLGGLGGIGGFVSQLGGILGGPQQQKAHKTSSKAANAVHTATHVQKATSSSHPSGKAGASSKHTYHHTSSSKVQITTNSNVQITTNSNANVPGQSSPGEILVMVSTSASGASWPQSESFSNPVLTLSGSPSPSFSSSPLPESAGISPASQSTSSKSTSSKSSSSSSSKSAPSSVSTGNAAVLGGFCKGNPLKVGYFASWAHYRKGSCAFDVTKINRSKWTHVIWAFATVTGTDITVAADDVAALNSLKAAIGHNSASGSSANPIKLSIAIGGWAHQDLFPPIVGSKASMDAFAKSLEALMALHGFDGLDI
ncbi:hypothetical protein HDU76_013620, partial [Blyttiomyces sp. JEL0837]